MSKREIKFRAWDKINKYMIDNYENFYLGGFHQNKWRNNRFKIMQYTGLKDKNGKEIYEGDIVKMWFYYDDDRPDEGEGIWEIYYRYDRWHLRNKDKEYDNGDYYCGDEINWEKAEIIGNIYENPELSEVK